MLVVFHIYNTSYDPRWQFVFASMDGHWVWVATKADNKYLRRVGSAAKLQFQSICIR